MTDPTTLTIVILVLALGGALKGAIGAGSPVVAVPVLSLFFGVPFAVAIFVLPNLLSNLWQGWTHRADRLPGRFTFGFALSGAIGAGIGSVMLARLPSELLMLIVALAVLAYVAFKLARPHWVLTMEAGQRLVIPAGILGGMMQGAGGISAPVSVTFLNALKPGRRAFIATISVFFAAMSLVQIPALWSLGILTPERIGLSLLACIPLFGAMPLGARAARHVSGETFDRLLLGLLTLIALRLIWGALA
jgi:uncharacterized membrane protein YfcA